MIKSSTKLTILIILAVFVSGIFFTSCKKKTPPSLPPESAFIMSDMDSSQQKTYSDGIGNWLYASTNVAVWTSLIKVGLAVPTAAYVEALKHEPTHVSGDKWLWKYDVNVGFATYHVKLYGTFNSEKGVDWQMEVSKEGGFQDFVWFTGTQNAEGTSGQWILYKSPDENHELLQIDWTRNNDNNTGSLKYTNIEPDGAENGGYIYYGNDQGGDYDAYYDIYNKGKDNLTEIDYNTTYHNGRVKDPQFFGDSLWHCWDENFFNVDCNVPAK